MPESPLNITQIPAPRVDFIDQRTGLMSREWYRFFINIYNLAGSGNSAASLDDLQVGQAGGGSPDALFELAKTLQDLQFEPAPVAVQPLPVNILAGTGSPNSVVVGYIGDLYLNKSGGASTTLYVKESGSGTNTGWVGK